MKLSPINFAAFRGREVDYASNRGESELKTMQGFYPNSSIERTLGSHHTRPRNKAYFADPMEFITDSIKERVDYVVYDNEPSYPKIEDVEKNYLEHNRTDYRKEFEGIREYYYRREMGRHANINEAKYQQWQAAKCTGFYDEAGDLRYKKETAEDEIAKLSAKRQEIQVGINSTKSELKIQQDFGKEVDKHIGNLEKFKELYENITLKPRSKGLNEKSVYDEAKFRVMRIDEAEKLGQSSANNKHAKFENYRTTFDAVNKIKDKAFKMADKDGNSPLKSINKTIEQFEGVRKSIQNAIDNMQKHLNVLEYLSNETDKEIASQENIVNKCKEKLKPLFNKLKDFYQKQGIKVIKK